IPARASSPARARTVTFMPPESPTPGGASGEECTDRTPTRRIGCACVSTRAPRSLPLRDSDAKHPRGCTRGCSHATGVWWLVVAATAGGGPGNHPGGPPVNYFWPTLVAASLTALVSAAAALRAVVPAAFTDDRVVRVLRRARVLAALVRETAVRVASAAWRVGRERRTPVTRDSPRRTSWP